MVNLMDTGINKLIQEILINEILLVKITAHNKTSLILKSYKQGELQYYAVICKDFLKTI